MNNQDSASVLESARLSMRSLSSADEDFYCSLYTNADVMRYAGGPLSRDVALEGFRKTLERMNDSSFERRVVLLLDRKTQQPIGISSVRMVRGKPGRAEVGTLLKAGMHEQGFGQECSTALISQAFSRPQIQELVAHSAPGHDIVERLLVDLGFERSETLPARNAHPARTVWILSRDAWAKRNAASKSN